MANDSTNPNDSNKAGSNTNKNNQGSFSNHQHTGGAADLNETSQTDRKSGTKGGSGISAKKNVTGSDYDGQVSNT